MTDYQIFQELLNQYLLPGDIIGYISQTTIDTKEKPLLLGNGLRTSFYEVDSNKEKVPIRVTLPGKFVLKNERYLMESGSTSLYIPKKDEPVIAQVAFKTRDSYIVNLTSPLGSYNGETARLDMLAFDGASKKNKPNLKVGAWIYARILRSERDLDTLITCESPEGVQKKDWVYADRDMFGELQSGWVMECADLNACNQLLNADNDLLAVIGECIGYDVVIAANGRIWVGAESQHDTVIVGNVIKNICMHGWSNSTTKEDRISQVKTLVRRIKSASKLQLQKMELQMQQFLKVQNTPLIN